MLSFRISSVAGLCAVAVLTALEHHSNVIASPLLFNGRNIGKIAPELLNKVGEANVELSRVDNNGWAAQYSGVTHWFDGLSYNHAVPRQGDTLKINKHLSMVNNGDGTYKVINKSNQWQNINFKNQVLVHVIAPKTIEVISPGATSRSLQVLSLSRQQASSIYRYNS